MAFWNSGCDSDLQHSHNCLAAILARDVCMTELFLDASATDVFLYFLRSLRDEGTIGFVISAALQLQYAHPAEVGLTLPCLLSLIAALLYCVYMVRVHALCVLGRREGLRSMRGQVAPLAWATGRLSVLLRHPCITKISIETSRFPCACDRKPLFSHSTEHGNSEYDPRSH
jgi:hypothetical protein